MLVITVHVVDAVDDGGVRINPTRSILFGRIKFEAHQVFLNAHRAVKRIVESCIGPKVSERGLFLSFAQRAHVEQRPDAGISRFV